MNGQQFSINDMIKMQMALMVAMRVPISNEKEVFDSTLDATAGLVIEASEALDELRKMRRYWHDENVDMISFAEELIDTLMYMLEIFILNDIDFGKVFRMKFLINMARIVEKDFDTFSDVLAECLHVSLNGPAVNSTKGLALSELLDSGIFEKYSSESTPFKNGQFEAIVRNHFMEELDINVAINVQLML